MKQALTGKRNKVMIWAKHHVDPIAQIILVFALIILIATVEMNHPYFFLQDDNRDQYLPYFVHNYRAALQGEVALYNFHQFMGTPHLSNGNSAALYPFTIIAVGLSRMVFGHYFATVDLVVIMHFLIGALGLFRLMRHFKTSVLSTFFSAFTWPLISFFFYIGNSWFIATAAVAWLPWMVLFGLYVFERTSIKNIVLLSVLRVTHFFAGHPQFFIYSVIFEFLFVEGYAIKEAVKQKPVRFDIKFQLRYLSSFVLTAIWSLPLLLPMYHQMKDSVRGGKLDWATFQSGSTWLGMWVDGLTKPYAGHVFQSISFFGGACVTLVIVGMILWIVSLFSHNKLQIKHRAVMSISLILAIIAFLWAGNIGFINQLIYQIPILNQFRWPYKLLIQCYFFVVIFAGLSLDKLQVGILGFLKEERRAGVVLSVFVAFALIMTQYLQFSNLYINSDVRAVRIHRESVPWEEPLAQLITGGRIASVGFDYTSQWTAKTLAFDYCTFWDLDNYAGYDAMLQSAQQEAMGGFGSYSGYYDDWGINQSTILERIPELRKSGVKYYVVNTDYVQKYGGLQLPMIYSDESRVVYEDSFARPLVYWEDNLSDSGIRNLSRTANKLSFYTNQTTADKLILNYIPNEYFHLTIDGKEVAITEGHREMSVELPAGQHFVRLIYRDLIFEIALAVSFSIAFIMITFAIVLKRKGSSVSKYISGFFSRNESDGMEDPMRLALMIIDLQKAYYNEATKSSFDTASLYINEVLPWFRKKNYPIIWVQHIDEEDGSTPGSVGFDFIDSLTPLDGEHRIHKTYGNSFNKTDCIDILKNAEIDTVLITGAGAEHCVLSTYRGALDLDLTPVILKNGIAGATPEHIKMVENISNIISYGALKKAMGE